MRTIFKVVLALLACPSMGGAAAAAGQYFPFYAGSDGSLLEFSKTNFYVTYFDDTGDFSYKCRKLSSLTSALHWGQCDGGNKFIFTFDPEHPETIKIGDVTYKECGRYGKKCS